MPTRVVGALLITWASKRIGCKTLLTALGEITGETVRDAVIEEIFSKFCIGK